MFFGNFVDEGDNPVNNQSIYNVEGDNRLSPGQQPLTTGSMLKFRVRLHFMFCSNAEVI
jgi:hypothetical protein